MKSKSFDLKDRSTGQHKLNKVEDFIGLYKPAAESKKSAEKRKSDDSPKIEPTKLQAGTSRRDRSPHRNKKRGKTQESGPSQVNIGSNLNSSGQSTSFGESVTSTPAGKVKSIMKGTAEQNISTDYIAANTPSSKTSKKRNKSVSFMLEENEEVVIKRTKSDGSIKTNKKIDADTNMKNKKRNVKAMKTDQQSEKENKGDLNTTSQVLNKPDKKFIAGKRSKKILADTLATPAVGDAGHLVSEKKKKFKKVKKTNDASPDDPLENESNNNEILGSKAKKLKKKKSNQSATEKSESGEPISKVAKKDIDPDIVSEDLENLSIGDNAHTLSNLLDDMTVVDKDKRKKLKQKLKKKKFHPKDKIESEQSANEEVKEKIKWKKRKWNKDRKGDVDDDNANTTVIVDGLPISIMFDYKKLVTEHFVKYGLIKRIGIAEVYPTEESKPVFTTTIVFYSDGAAEQALAENNSQLEGSRIKVKRALPATQTTLVARCYAELSDQALSSLFVQAGKIRSIRHLVKGKKSMATAFIEFDGPEVLERAIKLASDAKIGGKKIHVARFEHRVKKQKKITDTADSAADADSEASND